MTVITTRAIAIGVDVKLLEIKQKNVQILNFTLSALNRNPAQFERFPKILYPFVGVPTSPDVWKPYG